MKRLAILGSTGSIGVNVLKVVADFRDEFEILALAAGANIQMLREQIRVIRPRLVSVLDAGDAHSLEGEGVEVVYGEEGLIRAATYPGVDLVVVAVVGSVGVRPILAAIQQGKYVALANKESLVMAGEIIVKMAQEMGVEILPVDSEHSAIYQALGGRRKGEGIRRIILTASGGPFYQRPASALKEVRPEEALVHPIWRMGEKISIDSATLMNKGLEVIEAHWLFDIPPERIDVLIHPQGVVHSMVEFVDGSIIAQMSMPDMRIPIAYALSYPKRLQLDLPKLDLTELNHLSFAPPDHERFPSLRLAYEALQAGGTMPAVLNAANEVAVQAFLQGRIGFDQIPIVVAAAMEDHHPKPLRGIEDALEADRWARGEACTFIEGVSR